MHIKIVLSEPYVGMTSGGPTRYIGMINELYKRAHLSIFAPGDTSLLKQLFPDAIICGSTSSEPVKNKFSISAYLFSFLYPVREKIFLPIFDFYPELDMLIKENVNKNVYDAVYYFGLSTTIYFSVYDKNVLKFGDFCDSILRHFSANLKNANTIKRKIILFVDIAYLYRIKKKFIKKDISIIVTTEKDAACIKRIIPGNSIYSIPNGIPSHCTIDDDYLEKKWNSKEILFCGSLNYGPNIRAIEYVLNNLWEKIQTQFPGVHLSIVGRDPERKVIEMAAIYESVTIHKNVPDVFEYYKTAKLILAPIFSGGGIKNKILEALATGTPIVSNNEGVTGVKLMTGVHGFICETNEELVNSTMVILKADMDAYKKMVKKCYSLGLEYSWEKIGDVLFNTMSHNDNF